MVNKRITTELVVKAVDQYSNMIRNMSGVTGRFASNVRSEMGRLQALRGPLRLIEDYKSAQSTFSRSEVALRRARERVADLRREMRATQNPTKKMVQDFDRAKRAAERLRLAHEKNGTELTQLRGKLHSAGVNTGDLAGEQRRLTNALGAANTAFARHAERLERLKVLQDRMAAGRERMDRALARSANMSFAGHAAMGVGRRILSSTRDVANRSGDQQAAFTEFQNLTGADDNRIAQLRDELSGLRDVTKQSVDEMLAGLEVLVGKGMDLEEALGALPATARAAFASSTSSDEMGGAGFALYDNLKVAPEELGQAYDIMAMGGKEGGFELSAMAKSFPEITAGARALKMEGLDSVAQLTAALQIAMKSAGSEGRAATNLSNFLGKLTSPATVRKFAEVGISIEDELQKAMDRGVSPMEHMLGVIEAQTGGDALKMGELFEDKQVLDFLRAMIPNLEEYARIRDKALGAEGVVDGDMARKMRDFSVQKGQLSEAMGRLFTLPPETLDTLTAMLKRADAFVEKLIVWRDAHPAFVKGLFLGATALGAMAVAGGALLVVGAGLIGSMAVLRFGLVGLGARAVFAGGGLANVIGSFASLRRLPRIRLSRLLMPVRWTGRLVGRIPWAVLTGGKFLLSRLVSPLRWTARFIPKIGWAGMASRLGRFGMNASGWGRLITPLKWFGRGALRLIPVIGWAVMAAEIGMFAWNHLGLKALAWRDYLNKAIEWKDWFFSFSWADFLPEWSWDFITEIDLSGLIKWPEPPNWVKSLMGTQDEPSGSLGEVQERASGGPFGTAPLLVGEGGPELYFPNRSGFIANNQQTQRLQRGAQRVRSASRAALAGTALVGSFAAASAAATPAGRASTAHVEINGGIHIVAPSGVSDPEGLVDLLEARLGERVSATFAASLSD